MSVIHVVAGVLRDHEGRVLVTERTAGRHLAGLWEFPGGKCEPGETPLEALRRELREEIGVDVESARPLIQVPHRYPEKEIRLDVWDIDAYSGSPHPHEEQALRWVRIDELAHLAMPPADRPVVAALRLPDRYLITPMFDPAETAALLEGIERACSAGVRLIQLRQSWPRAEIAAAAAEALGICARHGCGLLVNADWRLADELGLDGVHFPARDALGLATRPIAQGRWMAVSCHDAFELAHAHAIGADFATLSPLAPTPSHPSAHPLGWPRFAELARDAALPVFALGGVGPADIATARACGAQGIAAIRALW